MIASAKFFGLPIKRRHGAALALALGLAGVLSVATPLFNVVGPPPVVVPAAVGMPGGPPGGVPSIAPPGGGGGGGIVVPPIITSETPVAPVTPLTPATPVPEPASWAMMLLGLGLLGFAARRRSPAATR